MKKILVIHNKYRHLGGEDVAVESEINILKENYDVRVVYFENKIENILKQTVAFVLNSNYKSNSRVLNALNEFNPDLVYIHNTWFKASLGIFNLITEQKKEVVIKLHNFRYFCTRSYFSSKHFSEENKCNACGLSRDDIGILNNYFKGSIIKSFLMNRYGKKYFQIIKSRKIKIIVLTNFHKQFLANLGINKSVEVIPNFITTNNVENIFEEEDYIVYAGRVSEEKGVEELIDAYLGSEITYLKLKIIGDGPILQKLKNKYKNENIDFLGEIKNKNALSLIKSSKAVVTATKLFEGQPTLLCEAASLEVPSIFPRSGGIEEFFPDSYKLSFEQFNYEDLRIKLNLLNNSDLLLEQGKISKEFITNNLSNEIILQKLNKII